jgi:hypothetical protein
VHQFRVLSYRQRSDLLDSIQFVVTVKTNTTELNQLCIILCLITSQVIVNISSYLTGKSGDRIYQTQNPIPSAGVTA